MVTKICQCIACNTGKNTIVIMAKKASVKDRSKSSTRGMINIELSPEAQAAVDAACEVSGMKKRELVARVLKWFVAQDEEVRALVLGTIPKSVVPMVTRHLLEQFAGVDKLVGHLPEKNDLIS